MSSAFNFYLENLIDGCDSDPRLGSLEDPSGDVVVANDLSAIGGKGPTTPTPMNESTLMDRCDLIGMSLIPAVDGDRSSIGKYSSSMMQLDNWTELELGIPYFEVFCPSVKMKDVWRSVQFISIFKWPFSMFHSFV